MRPRSGGCCPSPGCGRTARSTAPRAIISTSRSGISPWRRGAPRSTSLMPPAADGETRRPPARKGAAPPDALARAAVGLEAEFTLIVDGRPVRPEAVFRDPRGFIRLPLLHRTGTSYHLPNGAAVYFDTGVIEVATPAMELTRGCVTRAARSLWEAIVLIRGELDRWQRETGRAARLAGFSTHYNMSLSAGE